MPWHMTRGYMSLACGTPSGVRPWESTQFVFEADSSPTNLNQIGNMVTQSQFLLG